MSEPLTSKARNLVLDMELLTVCRVTVTSLLALFVTTTPAVVVTVSELLLVVMSLLPATAEMKGLVESVVLILEG